MRIGCWPKVFTSWRAASASRLRRLFFTLSFLTASKLTLPGVIFRQKLLQYGSGRDDCPSLLCLTEVNAGLIAQLAFADEFASLQKVRNCLEHRAGTVGAEDIDQTGHLTLTLPRLKMFHVNPAGEEVELAAGVIIDTHEHTGIAEIMIKREIRTKSYALGEKVTFNSAEFSE